MGLFTGHATACPPLCPGACLRCGPTQSYLTLPQEDALRLVSCERMPYHGTVVPDDMLAQAWCVGCYTAQQSCARHARGPPQPRRTPESVLLADVHSLV